MDWTAIGGNPVPAEVAPLLGTARTLRRSASDLQRWRAQATALIQRVPPVWQGQAAAGYVRAGLQLIGQSRGWERRLESAAAELVRFGGEVDQLNGRAARHAAQAAVYQYELQLQEVSQWHSLRLGIGVSATVRDGARSATSALAVLQAQADQLRVEYRSCEQRAVAAISELLA